MIEKSIRHAETQDAKKRKKKNGHAAKVRWSVRTQPRMLALMPVVVFLVN